jgi:hypothetical protein
MSDYLWDGSGKPDPETQRLENLLGRFRHNCPAPDFSQVSVESEERSRLSWVRGWWSFPRLAIATAVAILAVGSWYGYRISRPAWNVVRVAGTPQVGSRSIHENGRLGVGEYLQTDANSRAQINVGAVGTVDIEPNTRLRLLQARATEHRLALDHGTIHAYIWAPPRLFTVDTPIRTAGENSASRMAGSPLSKTAKNPLCLPMPWLSRARALAPALPSLRMLLLPCGRRLRTSTLISFRAVWREALPAVSREESLAG